MRDIATSDEIRVPIDGETGIVNARRLARDLSKSSGFDSLDQVMVAVAVSEIARDIVRQGRHGHILICCTPEGPMMIEVHDYGDGPVAEQLAITNCGAVDPGSALAIVHKVMDEVQVLCAGGGTVVKMTKHRGGPRIGPARERSSENLVRNASAGAGGE